MALYRDTEIIDEIKRQIAVSYLTIFTGLLGLLSAFIFFYFLRFKASTKQTDRDNRIKWSKFIPYRNETSNGDSEKESKDATFKDD